MAIQSTDIKYFLSGGAANSDVNASLGGAISSVEVSSNLLDDVSSAEAAAGTIEYRCIYVKNTHGSLTLIDPKTWIQANTPSATTTIEIGLGTAAINATEQTVANETTAPTGVTFSSPASFAAGLALTNLAAGAYKSIWIKRTVNAGSSSTTDTAELRVQGDSNP